LKEKIKQITIKKSIDKWYVTLITDAVIKTECGTKKELGISGGKGYLDNYNLIYQLNQRIKYLEDNCI